MAVSIKNTVIAVAVSVSIFLSPGCATSNESDRGGLVALAAIMTTTAIILVLPVSIGITEIVNGMPVPVGELDVTMSWSPYPPEQVESYIKSLIGTDKDAIECISGLHINWHEWSGEPESPPVPLDDKSASVEAHRFPPQCGPRAVDAVYLPGMTIEASSLARSILEKHPE